MKRREFIARLAAAAASPVLVAKAQQPAIPVVGFLGTGAPERLVSLTAFRQGLSEAGFVEDQTVRIEYRWAYNALDRLPALANELVSDGVSAIATPFSTVGALAARAATRSVPIIFSIGGDPVRLGLVASFARPGGNVTGVSYLAVDLTAKRLGLLHDLLPKARRIGVLVNPTSPLVEPIISNAQAAASTTRQRIEIFDAATADEIDSAFKNASRGGVDGLMIGPDTLYSNSREQLVSLADRYRLPTIYPFSDDAEAGGLASYGASIREEFYLVGRYTGRVLRGEKPSDLPVMQPTKFMFVINLKAARALNLSISETLLATADSVIE
jgi:putative tryptophan/tyrosine transport system substrate-binding protein